MIGTGSMDMASTEANVTPESAQQNPGVFNPAAQEPPKWKPRFWDNQHHAALEFATTDELDAAIEWLWSLSELADLPRVHVGRNTMIVPVEAVDAFRKRGFQFVVGQVRSMGDLSPEEANRIRKTG
jgi:hypothetical protein